MNNVCAALYLIIFFTAVGTAAAVSSKGRNGLLVLSLFCGVLVGSVSYTLITRDGPSALGGHVPAMSDDIGYGKLVGASENVPYTTLAVVEGDNLIAVIRQDGSDDVLALPSRAATPPHFVILNGEIRALE